MIAGTRYSASFGQTVDVTFMYLTLRSPQCLRTLCHRIKLFCYYFVPIAFFVFLVTVNIRYYIHFRGITPLKCWLDVDRTYIVMTLIDTVPLGHHTKLPQYYWLHSGCWTWHPRTSLFHNRKSVPLDPLHHLLPPPLPAGKRWFVFCI